MTPKQKRMRALVIAPQPFFSPRGTPLSVYYRTMITAEEGVEIDLLTYGEGQDPVIDGVRIVRIPRFAFLGNVKVGPSILKIFLDGFLILWTVAMLLRRRYHFVHAHEEAVFFCLALKPLFGFKLIYDMHSCLPQQLTNFKFTTSRFLIGAFERLERASLKASEAVITICPDLADYALGLIDDPNKHFLIENSIFEDVRLVKRTTQDSSASAIVETMPNLPENRPLVVYAGTLEPYQGIDLLVRAFAQVRAARPDAFLLIAGGTPDQVETFKALASSLGLDKDCLFTGRVAQTLARRLCARADVQVSPRISGTNTPLKVYEQLASGIPLVATDIYSHQQVLNDSVAFMAAPEPEPFGAAILSALRNSRERDAKIEAAKRLYAEQYSREVYVGKMRQLLSRVA
jgi:glycosyltransferase involved in cell wall biosynthesis